MKNLVFGTMMSLALTAGANASPSDTLNNQIQPEAVTVIALVKVKPGTEESFKEAALKILAPTRQELGNIHYEFNQSTDDPTEFATVERWRSEEDLDKHMTLPHMQTFFSAVGNYFEPGFPQIKKLKVFEN